MSEFVTNLHFDEEYARKIFKLAIPVSGSCAALLPLLQS
jgi:hypothetical protein